MNNLELIELLQLVAAGDELAFRNLFDRYRPNIYTTALRFTNNDWMAEDIVQDTFVKVWLEKDSLASLTNFEGWLYILAKNITLNVLKKKKNYKTFYEEEVQDALLRYFPAADYLVQEKEFQNLLKRAVDRLPPKQKKTYKLIKEEYHKRNEVAAILNVSPETVKWNLEQAMKSIRAYCVAHMKDIPFVLLLHFWIKYF